MSLASALPRHAQSRSTPRSTCLVNSEKQLRSVRSARAPKVHRAHPKRTMCTPSEHRVHHKDAPRVPRVSPASKVLSRVKMLVRARPAHDRGCYVCVPWALHARPGCCTHVPMGNGYYRSHLSTIFSWTSVYIRYNQLLIKMGGNYHFKRSEND